MFAPAPPTASRRRRALPVPPAVDAVDWPGSEYWVEPGTARRYPTSYRAYRRAREREEKPQPRHRGLGPYVDHYVWRESRGRRAPEAEVLLTLRAGTPPRIRRIVSDVLRAIRRGRPPRHAIRQVSRRFGLRHASALAFITASIGFELRPVEGGPPPPAPGATTALT